jgi:hypothetical protein
MNCVSVISGLPLAALAWPITRILPVGRTRATAGKKPPASAAGGVNVVIPPVPKVVSMLPGAVAAAALDADSSVRPPAGDLLR